MENKSGEVYKVSFQALSNALELLVSKPTLIRKQSQSQHQLGNDSSSNSASSSSENLATSVMLYEVDQSRKRKSDDSYSPSSRNKALKSNVVGNLSSRFASQVRLEHNVVSSESYMKEEPMDSSDSMTETMNHQMLSPFIINHIESLAKDSNVSYVEMLDEWERKKSLLENNLQMVTSYSHDSFDDIKSFAELIFEVSHWLCGSNFGELRACLPSWRFAENSLSMMMRFIRIVEDMQASLKTMFSSTGNFHSDSEYLMDVIKSKRSLYGDMLRENSIAWRVLGFPISEIQPLILRFHDFICCTLLLPHLQRVNALAISISHSEKVGNLELSVLLEAVVLIGEVIQLLGFSSRTIELFKQSIELSSLYLCKTLDILHALLNPLTRKSRFPDAKVCCIYESLIHLFTTLDLSQLKGDLQSNPDLQNATDFSPTSSSSIMSMANPEYQPPDLTRFLLPLFLPGIDAGLEICTYASKNRTFDGHKKVIVAIASRYASSLCNLMAPVLDDETVRNVQAAASSHNL